MKILLSASTLKLQIYKKGDDIAVEIDFFKEKFPKKMAGYVSDNKELASKIKSKQSGYNFIGIRGIFKEYNANCN